LNYFESRTEGNAYTVYKYRKSFIKIYHKTGILELIIFE